MRAPLHLSSQPCKRCTQSQVSQLYRALPARDLGTAHYLGVCIQDIASVGLPQSLGLTWQAAGMLQRRHDKPARSVAAKRCGRTGPCPAESGLYICSRSAWLRHELSLSLWKLAHGKGSLNYLSDTFSQSTLPLMHNAERLLRRVTCSLMDDASTPKSTEGDIVAASCSSLDGGSPTVSVCTPKS